MTIMDQCHNGSVNF